MTDNFFFKTMDRKILPVITDGLMACLAATHKVYLHREYDKRCYLRIACTWHYEVIEVQVYLVLVNLH